jgi:hypothetical protein
MKNKLVDLNDHLFAQLERLGDEELSGEALLAEVKRAEAIVDVSDQIVLNARLRMDAVKLVAVHGDRFKAPLQPMLGGPAQPQIEGSQS